MPIPHPETIRKTVLQFLQDNFPLVRHDTVGDDEKLLDSGIVDSLGLMLIIDFLETTFSITIGDTDVVTENFETLGSITCFVGGKLRAGA